MGRKYDYTPILGWSISRFETFNICRRKYYYSYYGKHDPEIPLERIKHLKELTAVPMETGGIFNDVVATLLKRFQKTDDALDQERFFDYAHNLTEKTCSTKEFAEVYFGRIDRINPGPLFTDVRKALENFLSSERYRWIMEEAMAISGEWIIEPGDFGETRIDGIKVYCMMDFLIPLDGRIHIIDWKAGKPNQQKYGKQLLAYAAAAAGMFDVEPQRIEPIKAYVMPEYMEVAQTFAEADIAGFRERVWEETMEMRSFCIDVEENIPKGKDEFPMTEHMKLCGYCEYRELCGR